MIVLDPEIEAKYEVLAKMGEGGMGSVYKVRHKIFGDVRVIKTSKYAENNSADANRFISEAKRGYHFRHKSIAKVIDFDITMTGTAYIVMELIEGQSLRQILATSGSALEPCRVVDIAIQVLGALQYLHERDLVHRDVSPHNIMLTRDENGKPLAKLIDLGIAKSMDASQVFTKIGTFIGKLQYASPEQFGGEVDRRSDLYSLGIVMYELLTGTLPFRSRAPSQIEMMHAHLTGDLRSIDEADPMGRVPMNLRDVVKRAMRTEPKDRFQTAFEFAEALGSICGPGGDDQTIEIDVSREDREAIALNREERIAWETAMASDSLQAWGDFLHRYPASARSDSARSRWKAIDQIDQKDWNEAADASTVDAWKDYLEKHPESPRVSSAQHRVKKIEDEEAERQAWETTSRRGTLAALESFIRSYPDSARITEARSLASRQRESPQAAAPSREASSRSRRRLKKTQEKADKASDNLPPATKLPIQLGRFTLLRQISWGKTGCLYKAYDPFQGEIGIKVVASDGVIDQKRMELSAQLWVGIKHENIVPIYAIHDVDPGDGSHQTLIATELVNGTSLDRFAAETRLTLEQSLGLVVQMCRALQHLHARDIIHREVKPGNILVIREGMKATLLDSGIARRATQEGEGLTGTGSIVGDLQLQYMAPEQLHGKPEQLSDLFSLAGVLYFLLTRTHPSVLDIPNMRQKVRDLPNIPSSLRNVLLKALNEAPSERFQSAEAFEAALKDFLPMEIEKIPLSRKVVTLHGIRTHARWQRAFSEVAAEVKPPLHCLLDRWNFGYFSVFRFILPWSRWAKVAWFRRAYQDEFPDLMRNRRETELPSIVAHSFGAYILGHALVRYPYLRFNKVILCGSILPTEFPWPSIIARGQVRSVRNEFGAQDKWTRIVDRFVPGTGASGIVGFTLLDDRIEQEEFDFSHSEYFERSHMESRWLPFLRRRVTEAESASDDRIPTIESRTPWLLYLIYVGILVLAFSVWLALR